MVNEFLLWFYRDVVIMGADATGEPYYDYFSQYYHFIILDMWSDERKARVKRYKQAYNKLIDERFDGVEPTFKELREFIKKEYKQYGFQV